MQTLHLTCNDVQKAADIIKSGGVVAIPTETVYGLAASAFDIDAISKIYKAKGRPSDNPLIVHICDLKELEKVISDFPIKAQELIDEFWPGPITMILPKNEKIPSIVTGGLDSVAVRFPSHILAQEIIRKSGVPLVAPSANLSGRPSPTKFTHVVEDLDGKIDAILDGGDCNFGLESTVISFIDETPILLRPGAITPSEIEAIIGDIIIDDSVYTEIKAEQKVISPGTKYKHYSPKTDVVIVKGSPKSYGEFLNSHIAENPLALCFDEDLPFLETPFLSYGSIEDENEQAKNLFDALRQADKQNVSIIYAHSPSSENMGIAVYNRLIRSAGFNIIEL